MRWMIDGQLGRRNLTPIQRVAVTEKYRPVFEEKAHESYEQNVGRPSKEKLVQNSAPIKKEKTRDVLAKLAGVSHDTYDKGRTILKSDNEEVKEKVLSGDMGKNPKLVSSSTCLLISRLPFWYLRLFAPN